MSVQPWKVPEAMQLRVQICVRAAELRSEGWPYKDIAAEFGLPTARDAQKCAEMGASFAPPDNVRMIRKIAEDQIMKGIRAAIGLISEPGPLVTPGIGIVKDEDGETLPDKTVVSQGISRLFEGSKQLAALHGANAPKQSVQMTMSATEIRALAEQVMAQKREIEERASGPGPAIPGALDEDGRDTGDT